MHELRYLRVSSSILERNFYESAQTNGVEQYSEQSRKPSSQQWILKIWTLAPVLGLIIVDVE